MQQHVKILPILNICLGGMGILAAVIVMAVFGGLAGFLHNFADLNPDEQFVPGLVGIVGGAIAILVLVLSLPAVIAGAGLLSYQPWARVLTIVLSALHLFHVPVGTALGVYGLWVLLSKETEPLFRRTAVAV